MAELVGVHFRNAGKVYYMDPKDLVIHVNDKVICMTQRGMEFGTVRTSPFDNGFKSSVDADTDQEIIRIATAEDIDTDRENRKAEDEAYKICRQKIMDHELEMKLVEAQYTFDRKKLTFYFLADGRVDFRALVKDLAASFHTRIELRQIGVRDETKIVGGIGICGRELCCATFLNTFSPVSIKMAKEQNLSLNPTKISGVCGRLMCCLKNEEEAYEELNKKLPRRGDVVKTVEGRVGEVNSVDVLRERVRVFFEEGDTREVKEYSVDDLRFDPNVHKKNKKKKADQDIDELETDQETQEILSELEKEDIINEEKETVVADIDGSVDSESEKSFDKPRNRNKKNNNNNRNKNNRPEGKGNKNNRPFKDGGKSKDGKKNRPDGGKKDFKGRKPGKNLKNQNQDKKSKKYKKFDEEL